MKRIMLLLLLIVCLAAVDSTAAQKEIARFRTTHAETNGRDITKIVEGWDGYIAFYEADDGDFFMANVASKGNSQSRGRIYDIKLEYSNRTVVGSTEVFTFKWAYSNTYDSHRGTCDCVLTLVRKSNGTASLLEMVTEKSEILKYNGFMEGMVDISRIAE